MESFTDTFFCSSKDGESEMQSHLRKSDLATGSRLWSNLARLWEENVSFRAEKLFLGGYAAEAEELPALATEVKLQKEAINDLKKKKTYLVTFSIFPRTENLEWLKEGRAYRPFIKGRKTRPMIAMIPRSLLGSALECDE